MGKSGGIALTNKASAYIVGASIGNTWRFSNGVYLGCEWFGYEQPIEQGFKETVIMATAGDKLSFNSKSNVTENSIERISKQPAISLLNIHLGIRF